MIQGFFHFRHSSKLSASRRNARAIHPLPPFTRQIALETPSLII
jgi:hypothetical protein